jgi:N-acetylmuramoyl-L-alanine amidase
MWGGYLKNKRIYSFFISMILVIFSIFIKVNIVQADSIYDDKGTKTNIELDKSWTVKFNQKLDGSTVSSTYICVTDENGQDVPVDLKLGTDESSIIVTPKSQYIYGKSYTLTIKDGLKGENKSNLSKPAKMQFTIKSATSNDNQKVTVCIDAAHGGDDPGNVSSSGIKEKDIDLSVALKAGKILQDNGVNVVYTRQSDNVSWSQDNDLKSRFDIANNAKADFFVSIHCNSFPDNQSANGIETYYSESDDTGKKLAQAIQNGLVSSTGLSDRGIKAGLLQHEILRGTLGSATMVELGFMSNTTESATLATEDFQNKSASAIANGILKSLNLVDKSKDVNISSIKDITGNVTVGGNYTLPLTVQAVMTDGSSKNVNVIWNSNTVDTSESGIYTYKGTVPGYSSPVNLALSIVDKPDTGSSNTTSGAITICIDPGHGLGSDTGATGIGGLQEDDVTLPVGLKLGKILQDHGVNVVYTRTTDMRSTPMSVVDSLQKRCDTSNNANAKYFISIHNNEADDPSASGTETWDNPGNTDSASLAAAVQSSIVQEVGTYDRGIKDGYGRGLYVIKNTNAPAILVELAFLSNPDDNAKLKSDDYQQKFAQAIADGVLKCLGKE